MPMSVVSHVHDSLEDVICKSETNVKRPDVRDKRNVGISETEQVFVELI